MPMTFPLIDLTLMRWPQCSSALFWLSCEVPLSQASARCTCNMAVPNATIATSDMKRTTHSTGT